MLAALLPGCGDAAVVAPVSTPPVEPEAGFVSLAANDYAIVGDGARVELRSGAARLWYALQPADEAPATRPLAVVWNGGPGASSAILQALGTGPRVVERAADGGARVVSNPARWTRFANVLWIDARDAGFSYLVDEHADDPAARSSALGVASFNPFVDAADVVRVLLELLAAHPWLERAPVVLVGESYGGLRASLALDALLHPDALQEGARGYEDRTLAAAIGDHLARAGLGDGTTPSRIAEQFGRLVLLQPRLSSPFQSEEAGRLFEAADGPLWAIADETGVAYVPCADKPAPCVPFDNALAFLDAAGRDLYDVARPEGSTLARYATLEPAFEDRNVLETVLGVDPLAVPGLPAASRQGGFRTAAPAQTSEPLAAALGSIPPWDRYFAVEQFELLGAPFVSAEAGALGIDRRDPRWGLRFLDDLRVVRAFVTGALDDAVIFAPALAPALARYDAEVAEASWERAAAGGEARPGRLRVRFRDGTVREARMPAYEGAGHSVTLTHAAELADDVEAWLATSDP